MLPNLPSEIIPHSAFGIAHCFACLHRPPSGDQPAAAAGTLAEIAREFSPRYECDGADRVTVDVSGLERLTGPPAMIAEQLRRACTAREVRAHVAVAATRTAALVLAIARPGVTVVARGDEAGALAPIQIGILEKIAHKNQTQNSQSSRSTQNRFVQENSAVSAISAVSALPSGVAAFKRWGLKTLGELAALPAADLASRIGKHALAWQAIARGEDTRPLIPTLEEERFEASLELEWPIEDLEPLSFVLTRLLEPLSTRLERRDRGAAVLHVLLRLVTREICARRLELPSPIRDVRTLRTLALLDLEAHPPSGGIDRVTIVIDPTLGRVLQHTLFTRAHPTPEQISTLLARLGALMGADRFGAPSTVDSYRPGAFTMTAFATAHEPSSRGAGKDRRENLVAASSVVSAVERDQPSAIGHQPLTSALRRCRFPVPARVVVADGRPVRVTTDRRGFAGGSVTRSAGPCRP